MRRERRRHLKRAQGGRPYLQDLCLKRADEFPDIVERSAANAACDPPTGARKAVNKMKGTPPHGRCHAAPLCIAAGKPSRPDFA